MFGFLLLIVAVHADVTFWGYIIISNHYCIWKSRQITLIHNVIYRKKLNLDTSLYHTSGVLPVSLGS